MRRVFLWLKREFRPLIAVLTALNILAFIGCLFFPGLRDSMQLTYPSAGVVSLFVSGLWLRMIGYTFVHSGVLHLLCNMLVLRIAGNRLVALQGAPRALAAYVGGAVGGGVGFSIMASVLDSASMTLCGASAAVLGVCGALLAVVKGRMEVRGRFAGILPAGALRMLPDYVPRRAVIGGVLLMTLICNPVPAATATHLLGFIAGAAVGVSQKVLGGWGSPTGRHELQVPEDTRVDEDPVAAIMEKVRRSGYSSLTDSERRKLRQFTSGN